MAIKTLTKAILAAGLVIGASAAMAAEKAKAPALMTGASDSMLANTCAGCHGTNGGSVGPASPSIGGLSVDYFTEVMAAYKSGDTASTIMGRIAKGYSDEEIAQLAKFYAGQKFVAVKQDFDKDAAAKGAKLHDKYCEKCHAEGGSSAEDDSGILAGQAAPYIANTMADFNSGARTAPKKMAKKLKKLMTKEGDAGLAALQAYYASQQ